MGQMGIGSERDDDVDLLRDAVAWVNRLTSGTATHADADELARWRGQSREHESAFREAARLRATVRAAAKGATAEPTETARIASPNVTRRMMIGGALAASTVGAITLSSGLRTPRADFATAKGESRKLALARGILVELNTATRMVRRPDLGADGVELLSGEAVLTAALDRPAPFVVAAGAGRTIARNARFNLRCDDDAATVTCLEGTVLVQGVGGERRLSANQQLRYDQEGLSSAITVDPTQITAWREGLLIFQDKPLRDVVAEVNRYRSGRIMIANAALADRRITGTFYVKRADQIIDQMRSALNARIVRLPGDVVVVA
jgi:transmembrane sensor